MISPTIGRMVWYHPSPVDLATFTQYDAAQPFHAMVVFVWDDRMVNLVVFDHCGQSVTRSSVKLLQDNDTSDGESPCAEWMPYQKGQAAKVEALEKEKSQ